MKPALAECRGHGRDVDLFGSQKKALATAHENIRRPDKARNEFIHRPLVDFAGRADLKNAAVIEDRDAVAHGQRFLLVMGDIEEGNADFGLDALELGLHLLPELEIKRAQRLVQQKHRRPVDNGARQAHALPLAAGKLSRPARSIYSSRTMRSASCTRTSMSWRGTARDSKP